MSNEFQISATVSASTREKLDRFTESHGLKKNFVIEQALLLDDDTFDRVAQLIEKPRPPTHALRELMRGQRR
jgi:hypothetical protein